MSLASQSSAAVAVPLVIAVYVPILVAAAIVYSLSASKRGRLQQVPVLGGWSLLLPLIAGALFWAVTFLAGSEASTPGVLLVFGVIACLFIGGALFAITALRRREKFGFLAWLGLVLNLSPLLFGLYGILFH